MTGSHVPFLGFDELFASIGVLGHEFSPRLAELDGQTVVMRGYLAPLDHDESGALVLTRAPFASCSGCGEEHDWPDDAVVVLPASGQGGFVPGRMTEIQGTLEHGPLRLHDTNTLVRLRDARWLAA